MTTQEQPRLISYLWSGSAYIGREVPKGLIGAIPGEVAKAWSDIGNTFQAVLYSGWHTQSAHNASTRVALDQAQEDDHKRIERAAEATRDGPEKD